MPTVKFIATIDEFCGLGTTAEEAIDSLRDRCEGYVDWNPDVIRMFEVAREGKPTVSIQWGQER